MNKLIYTCLLAMATSLLSCDKATVKPEIITLQISDRRQDCVGVGPQQCMLVKEKDDTGWKLFYGGIDGFAYEEGFEYKLMVRRETIENPPMDGSSFQYTLVELVEKVKK
ncbi:DUF4377 domain-containing protein [Spirosoma oryzicola]|uniref:DUF4377 domain-containing protein n=1 Tax=Spirosoma oryzicola TaxID=2898794 RepID=UPI001E39CCD9|nr:DUF4377 domain-containing protein [Spirosoma oryzicola]UHG89156.1 DUF4377 domain-containing protein [Spirosoma oryzicola]